MKKRRGRPPGSKNKQPAKKVLVKSEGEKPRRGRKPKNPTQSSTQNNPSLYITHLNESVEKIEKKEQKDLLRAATVIVASQVAYPALLQRHLKIGFNKATNLIKELEDKKVLGPETIAKPREVFVKYIKDLKDVFK